ncbi:CsbD family protein [Streptomyces sp. KS_5]|uniref:CsbD family protein n=3 Tax=Streptomyces TaxID=1883 RepID=UPI003526AAFF
MRWESRGRGRFGHRHTKSPRFLHRTPARSGTRRAGSHGRRVDTDRCRTLTGGTMQGHATPEHTAKHSAFPPRPAPARTIHRTTARPAMTVSRTIRNQAQTMKGRITEELGRVTRNRRLKRRGRADRVSGSLKQAVEKTKDAFRRNGSGPR